MQAALDEVVHVFALSNDAINARTIGHILVNRAWKWIWLLCHPAEAATQSTGFNSLVMDTHAIEQNVASDPYTRYGFIDAVETFKKCRFSAARRADEGSYLAVVYRQINIFERM